MGGKLTQGQAEEFLAGYRQTFLAKDQSVALKELYSRFEDRYGVPVAVLRKVISRELETNPSRYRALRNELAARLQSSREKQAAAAARKAPQQQHRSARPVEHRACPACKQTVAVSRKGRLTDHQFNGTFCSGQAAPCSVCKETHPLQRTGRRLVHHVRADGQPCAGSDHAPRKPKNSKTPTAGPTCPVCGRPAGATANGTVNSHTALGTGVGPLCSGSGMKITPPRPSKRRPDDRSESRSVRATSSGLGGLGKR